MAVFRVERTRDYTVMSNHHLKNKDLSLKAKGLLSQMLSLPENWDYTLRGLSAISKEGVDAISEAVKELERSGYVIRNPSTEKPSSENPTQLKIDQVNIQEENTQGSNTHSILSGTPDVKRSEMNRNEIEQYRALIEENIDYDILLEEMPYEQERLEEIVGLMTDTVCSSRSHIRVAGSDFPAEVVKSRLLKLNAEHIRFVFDCLKKNTTEIRNIRQYLLTALYNAPVSINSHYAAQVNHDLYG